MATLPRTVNRKAVLSTTGWSKGTLENRIKAKQFPPPIDTGDRTRVWLEADLLNYLAARVADRDEKGNAKTSIDGAVQADHHPVGKAT